jgi:hypothetical protein
MPVPSPSAARVGHGDVGIVLTHAAQIELASETFREGDGRDGDGCLAIASGQHDFGGKVWGQREIGALQLQATVGRCVNPHDGEVAGTQLHNLHLVRDARSVCSDHSEVRFQCHVNVHHPIGRNPNPIGRKQLRFDIAFLVDPRHQGFAGVQARDNRITTDRGLTYQRSSRAQ